MQLIGRRYWLRVHCSTARKRQQRRTRRRMGWHIRCCRITIVLNTFPFKVSMKFLLAVANRSLQLEAALHHFQRTQPKDISSPRRLPVASGELQMKLDEVASGDFLSCACTRELIGLHTAHGRDAKASCRGRCDGEPLPEPNPLSQLHQLPLETVRLADSISFSHFFFRYVRNCDQLTHDLEKATREVESLKKQLRINEDFNKVLHLQKNRRPHFLFSRNE